MPLSEGLWPWVEPLILPAIALGLAYVALIARITRASMLEVLSEDYMRTARAKGASHRVDAVPPCAEATPACRSLR